jgi:hypothetical protein
MGRRSVEWQGTFSERFLNPSDCQFEMSTPRADWKELHSVVQFGNYGHAKKEVRWSLRVEPIADVRIRPQA